MQSPWGVSFPLNTYFLYHIYQHVQYIPIVGVGKWRRIKNWPMGKPENAAVSRIALRTSGGLGPVLDDSRQ